MAKKDATLKVDLGTTDTLNPDLKKAQKNTKKLKDATSEGAKKGATDYKKLAIGVVAVGVALAAVVKIMKEVSALGREGAVDKMLGEAAVKNFGNLATSMNNFRKSVNFTRTDTDLMKFANTLARFGTNAEGVNLLLREMRDASKETGQAFETIESSVSAAIASGNARSLRRVFGELADEVAAEVEEFEKLNGTLTRTERALKTQEVLVAALAEKHGDSTEAIVLATDKYDKLGVALGNLKSDFAATINDSAVLNIILKEMTEVVEDVAKMWNELPEFFGIITQVKPLVPNIIEPPPLPELKEAKKTAELKPVQSEAERIAGLGFIGQEPGAGPEGDMGFFERGQQQQRDIEFDFAQSQAERITEMEQDELQKRLAAQEEYGRGSMGIAQAVNSSLMNGYLQLSVMFGETLGQMMFQQEVHGSALLASVLDLLGQFAIKVGAAMVAYGIGLLAIQSMNPYAAIAGGIALAIAGGVMMAASSSLRSEGQANASGAAIPGGGAPLGGGASATGVPSLTPREDREDSGTQTIIFNINGVVGGQDTARTINGLINKHSGKGAPRIDRRAVAQT